MRGCFDNPCFHNGKCTYAQCGRRDHLVLFRGDDTSAAGGTGFEFFFKSPLTDLTGYEIEFSFLGVVKTEDSFNLHDDGRFSFTVQFTHDETKTFPYCWQNATLVLVEKATGLRRTITNSVLIRVTNDVNAAYDSSSTETDIEIKPGSIFGAFSGITLDLNASLAQRMESLAEVIRRGGGTVIDEEESGNEDDGQ